MKKEIHIFIICLLCLSAATHSVKAQMMYKGQFYINEIRFQRAGQLLHIDLKVSYDKGVVNANESLIFTPVIKSREHVAYFSSVVVNGSKREKTEHRTDHLQNRRRINIPVAIIENRRGTKSFVYETSIPYAEWMRDGQFYIETEECGYDGRKSHIYEDLLFTEIPIENLPQAVPVQRSSHEVREGLPDEVKRFAQWVEFVMPTPQAEQSTTQCSGVILWNTKQKNLGKLNTKAQNIYIGEYLNNEIKAMQQQHYDAKFTHLSVTGYGVPIGGMERNEKKCMQRAFSLKSYLLKNVVEDQNEVSVNWVSEDWDSIVSLIGQRHLPLKEAIVDIIRTIKVADGRERALMNLNKGIPYENLRAYIFPQVPRLKYTMTFSRTASDENTARFRYQKDRENLTLSDFYTLIRVYEPGTQEFNDLVDLAARLFPDNAEANINAAAVALIKGNISAARSYLNRWKTDPRAYNNMGILCLMERNTDKAEVYLEMARAAGVKQAEQVLNHILNYKL